MVQIKKNSGKGLLSPDSINQLTLHSFGPICKALKSSALLIDNKQVLNENFLASITSKLFNHYQTNYGKSSPKPRPITIPSSKLFFDFDADGSLFVMLSTLLVGASIRELLPFEQLFDHPASVLLPILHEIDKNLTVGCFHFVPRIFLNSVPVGLISKLSKIAIEHGGELTTNEDSATHVIDWNDEIDANNDSADDLPARVIDLQPLTNSSSDGSTSPNLYLVHWPFQPDSSNEWVEETALQLTNAEQQAAAFGRREKGRYYVSCRFLLDTDLFNEWSNEGDYENSFGAGGNGSGAAVGDDEEAENAPITRKATKGRGRRQSSSASQNKAKEKEVIVPLATNLYEKLFADVLPASATRSLLHADVVRVLEIESTGPKLTMQQIPTASDASESKVESEVSAATTVASSSSKKRKLDAISSAEDTNSNDSPAARVWLSMDSISDFERRVLGSQVLQESSASGRAIYMQIRNAVLQLYLLHPSQYLSATECRRKIAGDVAKIARIHEFLDAFGAINYAVKLEARPFPAEDFSLTARRQALLDRVSRWPSCSVFAQSTKEYATKAWTEAMDAALVQQVKEKCMDWQTISQSMLQWLEQHVKTLSAATKIADAPSQLLVQLDPLQRQQLVSPLLCMLHFLEMQLQPIVRTSGVKVMPTSIPKESNDSQNDPSGTNGSSSSTTVPVSNEPSNNVPHSNGHEVHVKMEVDNESAISSNKATGIIATALQDKAPLCAPQTAKQHLQDRLLRAVQHLSALDVLLEELRQHNSANTNTVESDTKSSEPTAMDVDDDSSAEGAAVGHDGASGREAVQSYAQSLSNLLQIEARRALRLIATRHEELAQEQLQQRLKILEDKLELFTYVEQLLRQEREALEVEKRDFALQKLLTNTTTLLGPTGLSHSNSAVALDKAAFNAQF